MENNNAYGTVESIENVPTRSFHINYIQVFLAAFVIFGIATIPSLITSKGIWIYYGDFNVQQIPFYMHVQNAVRNGNFLYDWSTDLGGSFLGCYSFYLTGSPFFWLACLFPNAAVPYLMPWISALKYAVMATTAFAFSKRYLKTDAGAFIASLLFAFSGYSGAVLVYNHFHDAMAFFPLYLITFEDCMEKKKRLPFVLMTTLMLVINYFFFAGTVVFLVIYFFAKYVFTPETIKEKVKMLFRAVYGGITGVALVGVYIIPSIYYTLHNSRLSRTLSGYDLIAYSEPTMIWGIIKNMVMLPDVSGLNSMLNQSYSRVSGVAAYIPFFSIAFVIAFFLFKRKEDKNAAFLKRLLIICGVFAAVPMLNAAFSALNQEYYARWFYMPVLVMAVMTASVIEERKEAGNSMQTGAIVVFIITAIISIMALLPSVTEEGETVLLGSLSNYEQLISEIVFSFVMVVLLFVYTFKWYKKDMSFSIILVICACFVTTETMFITGTLCVPVERKGPFVEQAVKGESPFPDDGTFYRIETDEDIYNYPMFWDEHSITSFISTVPDSVFAIYESQDYGRTVVSNIWKTRVGFRAITSTKYYLSTTKTAIETIGRLEDIKDLKDYTEISDENGYKIYENGNYIPMGFTFEEYVTEEEYEQAENSAQNKDKLLTRFLILSEEDAEEYEKLLSHGSLENNTSFGYNGLAKECKKRRENSCSSFNADSKGFTATIDLEKENLVFFSVPYEEGFKAYVDGKETKIVKADFGFMAVPVMEGQHTIEFRYSLSGLKDGCFLSLAGVVLFAAMLGYTVVEKVGKKKKDNENSIDSSEDLC